MKLSRESNRFFVSARESDVSFRSRCSRRANFFSKSSTWAPKRMSRIFSRFAPPAAAAPDGAVSFLPAEPLPAFGSSRPGEFFF